MTASAATPAKIKGTSITTPTESGGNHTLVLGQLKEVAEIGQRLRGDPNDSFVRVKELINATGARLVNGTIQPPNKSTTSSGTVSVLNSITGDGSSGTPLQLVGDVASPGNNMVYGTNGSGVRSWYAAGGGTYTPPVTTKGDLFGFGSVPARVPVGADTFVLTADSTQTLGLKWATPGGAASSQIVGAAWVSTGGIIVVPVNAVPRTVSGAFTIKEVIIVTEGGSGSCVINVWKANLSAHYPPVLADDITGGVSPAISGGVTYQNSTLTGWALSLAQDDVLLFTLASSSTFTFVSIQIRIG